MENKIDKTCIICPNSCKLSIIFDGEKVINVEGAFCVRGIAYAKEELLNPMRTLITTVKVNNGEIALASVRSDIPIAKDKILLVINLLKTMSWQAPIKYHQVLINDVLGTKANIIATKEVHKIK